MKEILKINHLKKYYGSKTNITKEKVLLGVTEQKNMPQVWDYI